MALLRRHPIAQSGGRSLLATTAQQRRGGAADEVASRQVFGPVELTTALSTGWLSPTNASGSWTNLANVYSENGVATTQAIGAGGEGGGLYAFGYPFSIPAGSRIKGIQIRVKGRVTAGSLDYSYAYLVRHPTFQPNSVTSYGVTLSGSEGTVYAGGADNLWGTVTVDANQTPDRDWVVADFDGSWGVFAAFGAGGSGATVAVDTVQVNVHYWPALATSYSNTLRAAQSYDIETTGAAGFEWTDWLSPVSSASSNTIPWLNPTAVHARDSAFAEVTTSESADNSMYSVWNAADIPVGATLNGVQLRIRGYSSGASSLALYLYNYDDSKYGHIRTVNLSATPADRIAGDAFDLFLPMGAGSTFTADDFRSNGWNVLFGEDTDGVSTYVDSIEARFNYSEPTTSYLDTSYSNSGTGAQSYSSLRTLPTAYAAANAGAQAYSATYRALTTYSNTATGSHAYAVLRSLPTGYGNAGNGTQTYSPQYRASTVYAASGSGQQDYASAFAALTPYLNAGEGTISYSSAFATSTGYANTGSSAQSYSAGYRAFIAYLNEASGAQSYSSIVPGPVVSPYLNAATGSQSYSAAYRTVTPYANTGIGAQDYRTLASLVVRYSNAGVGLQNYRLIYATETSYEVSGVGAQSYTLTYRIDTSYSVSAVAEQDYAIAIVTFVPLPDRLAVTVEWHDWVTSESEVRRVARSASYSIDLRSEHALVVPANVEGVLRVE